MTAAGCFAGAAGLAASSREFVFSRGVGGVNFLGGCAALFVSFVVSGLGLAPALLFALPAGGFTLLGCAASFASSADVMWKSVVTAITMGPGDTIVVPEKPVLGSNRLKNVLSVAQIASSAALVAAVAIP